MQFSKLLLPIVVALAPLANATVIYTVTDQLDAGDPTQLGRLFRDGAQSDWSVAKPFPGGSAPTDTFNYFAYPVNVGLGNYLQISVDWGTGVNGFASAYQTAYNSASLSTNYLGDIGGSGDVFTNPGFFQVIAAQNSTVYIVINNAAISPTGLGEQYSIMVESFTDVDYTDPVAVPEPQTISLMSFGLGSIAFAAWRRRKSAAV